MGTTADKLNRLIGTKQAIREAIVSKGVSVSASDTFRSYATKIAAIPQEGGGTTQPSAGAVTFRDYDGTVLHAYSKDEFLALTAMPALPTQPNLTCQGWNYTLEDAQAYVEEYGKLDVGATYITDDGKTRLYITIAADGRMDVPLYFYQNVDNGVTIDWGDGSPTETLIYGGNVNTTHHYDEIGDYVITLEVADGCTLGLGHNSSSYSVMGSMYVYRNMLQKVEVGERVTSINSYAFYSCYTLASVSIPNGVTSIGSNAFQNCYTLASVSIPNGVTSINSYAFNNCYTLASVSIPNGVTSIGNYAFSECRSLSSVVIPSSVTSIGSYAFNGCSSLAFCDFSEHTSIPTCGSGAFSNIPSDCKIIVPPHLYDEWKNSSNWNLFAAMIWTDYEPTECTQMTILNLPERVTYGQIDTITFDVEAITNGVDSKGNRIENVPWSGFVNFNIGKNLSDTDVTKELTYTYLGNSVVFTVIHGAYLTNAILCKYNVTSTTNATTLLYSSFANMAYFESMDIDGVDTPIAKTHTFSSTGEHYVAFKIAEGASITNLYRMFSSCASLRYVDCSELDMSAVTSTSSSNGTAYMFYGCNGLQQIILPDTVKYLGYYMFYNCVSVVKLTIKAATAPTVYGSSTWGYSSSYLGYLNRAGKRNKLYVPSGATGYVQTGSWANLYNTSYCGFTKEEVENL